MNGMGIEQGEGCEHMAVKPKETALNRLQPPLSSRYPCARHGRHWCHLGPNTPPNPAIPVFMHLDRGFIVLDQLPETPRGGWGGRDTLYHRPVPPEEIFSQISFTLKALKSHLERKTDERRGS